MANWISSLEELEQYLIKRYGTDELSQHTVSTGASREQTHPQKVCEKKFLLPEETAGTVDFPLRIPYYYADLIDWENPQDPLRLIAMPRTAETVVQPYELTDPIGDHEREVVPGLIHRYPDRCLLLLTTHCKIHCRFCFRREVVGKVRPVNFAAIKAYLLEHTEIKEVIFSGGDPGTFPPAFIINIVRQLGVIPHIERWRFHTRVPAVDPESISTEWLEAVDGFVGKKIIVIHTDHPNELTHQLKKLVDELLEKKFLVLSQSVLLKGVNDDLNTLKIFFTKLVQWGIKPYYLHHLDQAKGTSHFRISIEAGINIFKALRGNLSSICLPEYVLDLPEGFGKVPVLWLEKVGDREYKTVTFTGATIYYTDRADDTP